MNPFYRQMEARQKTPLLAQKPEPKGSGVVTLRLYDAIDSWGGYWGVSAKEFTAALDDLDEDTTEIRLMINSPGGHVWEGLAILNALRAHPAKVVAVVEGIAASSASFIAAGVDECVMMPNSEMFIHNAWGLCVGNSADMTRMARDLTQEDRNLASIYQAKAGGTVDEWLARMADELFFIGQDAVDVGLADRVEGAPTEAVEQAKARFDLSVFNRRQDAPAAAIGGRAPVPDPPANSEPGQPNRKDVDMSDTLMAGLRERLGMTDAETSEDAVLAALDEALAEQAEPAPVAKLPEGVVAIEASQLDELKATAAEVRAIREERAAERRESLVQAAIEDGRIAPARRDAWLKQLSADEEGAAEVLASLEPGTIPVAEVGHSDDVPDEEAEYARYYPKEA